MNGYALRKFKSFGTLPRDSEGATIVEFAMILTPLCILLMGGLDLGYQSYVRAVLQGALNDVTRAASMESPMIGCEKEKLEDKVKCAVEERVNDIARNAKYDLKVKSFYDFSGVGRSEKLITDENKNLEYDKGDCWEDFNRNGIYDLNAGADGIGGADDVVFYEMTVTMPRLIPVGAMFGLGDNYTMTARAAVRNQPYARQKSPPKVCS